MIFELFVIVAFLGLLYAAAKYVNGLSEQDQTQKASFFGEADKIMGIPYPETEIHNYDSLREELYKCYIARKVGGVREPEELEMSRDELRGPSVKINSKRLDFWTDEEATKVDDNLDPEEYEKGEWIRRLPPNENRVLKIRLFLRADANIPRYERIRTDVYGKWQLYKKYLITEQHWKSVEEANALMAEEIQFIKKEADFLEEGWGRVIFPQAFKLREERKERETREQEALEKKKSERRAVRDNEKKGRGSTGSAKEAEQKEPKGPPSEMDEARAEKMAQQLMKEEAEEEAKKTRRRGPGSSSQKKKPAA
uniref:Uncharacterized protein n=1 Tax=Chromera velia CCMP2878 TaxID=1169474 RepID=A0A0G4FBT6_9ALVE|eukprot:Cvel_16260.t1-p1 / transcript=Cvel_16260.t1 / gene=Cvel_16260 / organism=Chromera_velia_CCMP2878 / gene_product=hypothetical protein / transcript_product=hypothetical protein / location=Cvel_scaffold1244:41342-44087(+) / protein_length=309 / sequence_SO=supercontig / SO=protein_coding / is_pseudo=false